MDSIEISGVHDWLEKMRMDTIERSALLRDIDGIISGLSNDHLKQLLSYLKTLDRAQKIELIAQLESGKLTDYGKKKLEALKEEIKET